jgi:hypothetical protein
MTQHEEIMAKVCVCTHKMEDHAWTAEDAVYCMMSSCRCRDFADYGGLSLRYEEFREQVLAEAKAKS